MVSSVTKSVSPSLPRVRNRGVRTSRATAFDDKILPCACFHVRVRRFWIWIQTIASANNAGIDRQISRTIQRVSIWSAAVGFRDHALEIGTHLAGTAENVPACDQNAVVIDLLPCLHARRGP